MAIMKQSAKILKETIDSFEEGDRFVTDNEGIRYIREDIVEKAIENSGYAKNIADSELLEACKKALKVLREEYIFGVVRLELEKAIKKATE